jgi:hypothetical protein
VFYCLNTRSHGKPGLVCRPDGQVAVLQCMQGSGSDVCCNLNPIVMVHRGCSGLHLLTLINYLVQANCCALLYSNRKLSSHMNTP